MIKRKKMDKTDAALWVVFVVWCVISVIVIVASTSEAHANPAVPTLEPTDHANDWSALPSGLVVIPQGKYWVVHPYKMIPCYDVKADVYLLGDKHRMVFTSDPEASEGIAPPGCYLIEVKPIGYFKEDPSIPESFNVQFFPWEIEEKEE